MASILTTSQIVSEYGQYYIKEGQNRSRLIRALQQMPTTLEKHARHIRTTETKYRMANYKSGAVLQPFSTTFNPISDIEFIPNQIDLQKIKVNVRVTPDEIEDQWLAFMSGNTTRNKKDWPIVRFLMEEYIAKQIGEDRENNMVYKGIRNDGGSTPGACLDGIKKQLIDGVAKSEYPINVINGIGQLDPNSIFDQIEAFDEALPHIYRTQPVTIFVSPKWFRAFMKDRRAQTFYQLRNENDLDTAIDFTGGRHRLVALPSMDGTDDIWATVPDNLLWLTIRDMNTSSADVQAMHYDVDIMLDWWEGLGFACNKEVWVTAETVGLPSAVDTASPSDGINVRTIYPIIKNVVAADTSLVITGKVIGDIPSSMTVTFKYGTSATTLSGTATATLINGEYKATISGLNPGTEIFFQMALSIGTDQYVSEIESASTTVPEPEITLAYAANVNTNSAAIIAAYTDVDNVVEDGGVEYTQNISQPATDVPGTPSSGSMSVSLSGLDDDELYYYRAYIEVDGAKKYSSWSSFRTEQLSS